jgi:predicted nucleotidyltransferase
MPISPLLSIEENMVKQVLARFAKIDLAIVFGSVAKNSANNTSDLDIAVSTRGVLSAEIKIEMVSALAQAIGRPIDLIDLRAVGEPLLGQILQHGHLVIGSANLKAKLINQHIVNHADFIPYQTRMLTERRNAWISQ